MKQTERIKNHGLLKLLLIALVMLLPIGAWGQTGYRISIGTESGDITRVTSENATAITGPGITGTVTYNAVNNILTLNNATIVGTIYSYGDLTIELTGDNFVTANDSSAIKNTKTGAELPSLTFKGTGLLMAKPYSAPCVDGFDEPTYEDGQKLLLGDLYYESVIGTQLFSGGNGTSLDTPYLISTFKDLKNLSLYVNEGLLSDKFYQLQNDIDCTGLTGFVPIGNSAYYPFSGTFNGNNKKIIGLNYTTTNTADYVGLFAKVGDNQFQTEGNIENLELKDCSFGGSSHVGAIAGYFLNGSMLNCKVSGNTTISAVGDNAQAGALIGNYYTGILTSNYYYYSVTTSTTNDVGEIITYGYDQRAIGNADDDVFTNNGAVMYTKLVNIPGETAGKGSVEGSATRYARDGADYETEMYISPGETAKFSVQCEDGYIPQTVQVTYGTPVTTIYPTLESLSGNKYNYKFEMPDEVSTISVTYANGTGYNLLIGNTQVTSANKDDVLGDGKVSFSVGGDVAVVYTLTLKGAELTEPIKIGLVNLTFDIQGANSITTTETCIQKIENTNPSLTFKSTSAAAGDSLTLKNTGDGLDGVFTEGYSGKITFSKEVAPILLRYGSYTSDTYYLTAGEVHNLKMVPSYGVIVNDMQVYEGNASDVLGNGKVSFDKDTNTLTLDNATSISYIGTYLSTLNVDLTGNNSIYRSSNGNIFDSTNGADTKTINIKSTSSTKGSLSISTDPTNPSAYFKGNNVSLNVVEPLSVLSGDLATNSGTVVIGMSYGISVTKATVSYPITSVNRKNVLDDESASVQFDGVKTLILNDANLSSIDIAAQHDNLPELTIYLTGNNTVNNGEEGIGYGGDPFDLTFATDNFQPGTLNLSYDDPGGGKTPSTLFYNITISYANNLSASLNTQTHIATIAQSMPPIVSVSDLEEIVDGDGDGIGKDVEGKSTGDLTAGVIVNKILYRLPDADDGYLLEDGNKLVCLNSYMTDAEMENIATQVEEGTLFPGTEGFAAVFKGMCFLVPVGSGDIIVECNTSSKGKLHVYKGKNDIKEISVSEGFETITIPYAFTEDTYVYLYSAVEKEASSRLNTHRAPGKKTATTTRIRRAGVSAGKVCSAPSPSLTPKSLTKGDITLSDGFYVTTKNVKVSDDNVIALDDDVFEEIKTNNTPLTYVDLSETAIIDLTVDRTKLPFSNLPATTFIYLPAGNKAKEGEKNVVIGTVSDDVKLMETGAFEAPMDFTASKATLDRDFTEKIEKKCSIFLPFALDEETAATLGTFYQIAPESKQIDTKLVMETVDKTEANVPYMFKPAVATVSVTMAKIKKDIPDPTSIKGVAFCGAYEDWNIQSNSDFDYYCFKNDQFIHVIDADVTISPFRAYLEKPASSSLSKEFDIDWGDGTTSIENMKVGINNNVYYDLQGRRVLYPTKGIYILNGKKVVIK